MENKEPLTHLIREILGKEHMLYPGGDKSEKVCTGYEV